MANPTDQGTAVQPPVGPRRRLRWWPLLIVFVAAAGALVWVWGFYGRQRQDRNLASEIILLLAGFLVVVWAALLSRLPWKSRLVLVGSLVLPVLLIASLFRIQGVTGDLVPVLRWRWGPAAWNTPGGGLRSAATNAPGRVGGLTTNSPQCLGPNRNGTLAGPRLARDWQAQPPERLWRQPVGTGWSGFAVAGNRAITLEQRGDNETVTCYELFSGAPLWSYGYPAHFQSTLAGEGPRATPTIVESHVYTLGSGGLLSCLELETGKPIWAKDIVKDNGAQAEVWGMTSSPLVVGDLVVVSAGGKDQRSLVAYRAADGTFAWGGGTDGAGYSSALLAELAGVRQIVIFNAGGVFGHDPATGGVLWHHPWPGGHPHVSVPLVLGPDRLLVSSGYGTGSESIHLQKGADGKLGATRIWKSNRLKAKFTNLVCRNGFIYGLDDGIMACLDAATGEQKWKEGRYGHGQELLVGDLLLVGTETGEMILLDPQPQAARELSRFAALEGKTWNPPALAGEYLVVRNDKQAACYRLPLARP